MKNQRITFPARQYFPVVSLFILGIVVSLTVFWFVRSWEQKNLELELESWARAYSSALESTLNEYVGAVLFLGDFYNNSTMVTRREFDSLTKSILPRYPGIQALGWDPLVKRNERATYESLARKEGFDNFEFTERTDTNELVRAANRDEYVAVYYILPLEDNKSAFGFDIASNSTRLEAITKAFNTGKLVATNRITLVQETGHQFGILLLQPVYHQGALINSQGERQKSRKGFVVEVLRVGTVAETALKGFSDEGINLTMYDMSASVENRFLYHRSSRRSNLAAKPMPAEENQPGLVWSKTFDLADRQWKIIFSPSDFYFQSRIMWQGWTVLFGSLILTIFMVFYMLKKIRHEAEIEQRMEIQEETNIKLENEIKERSAAEIERDKTIENLQHALEEVKTLKGILPICSHCNKVRDDKGYREQVEVYVHKHSQTDFTHGICPDCVKQHYPEVYDDNAPDQE